MAAVAAAVAVAKAAKVAGGGGGGDADTASKSAVVHAAQDCGPPLQVDEPPVVEPVPQTPPAVPPPADTPGNGTGTGSGAILGVTLPPPVLGKSFNLEPLFGSVYVSLPPGASVARAGARAAQTTGYVSPIPGRRFIPLSEARQVPMGSLLDMRTGIARLTTASTVAGLLYKGKFAAGVVQVLQSASVSQLGLTDMRMRGSTFKTATSARTGRQLSPPARRSGGSADCAETPRAVSAAAGAIRPQPYGVPAGRSPTIASGRDASQAGERRRTRLPPGQDDPRARGQDLRRSPG